MRASTSRIPCPDANAATSEAIFVFTDAAPTVAVGDDVQVVGTVTEFRPGGAASTNLTTTEITSPAITVLTSGNALPAATVVGTGGRVPPGAVIDDDATGSVETSGTFDATTDGIDFYESLEAMRVQVNAAVAVGPTNGFGEIPIVGDAGANAGIRTNRGGVVISAADFNPERLHLDDTFLPVPIVNVGDGFTTAAVGVLDYSFGNFKLNVTTALTRVAGPLAQEVTAAPSDRQIAVATYNVENLDPSDTTFATHADYIVNHLRSPGSRRDRGDPGLGRGDELDRHGRRDHVEPAHRGDLRGGRADVSVPADQPGRRPGRGRAGRQHPGRIPVQDGSRARVHRSTRVGRRPRRPRSSTIRPGRVSRPARARVDPGNAAWANSRKPLAGEFRMRGKKVFVIVNHFNSKGGDHPLLGRFQPPVRSSEVQRHAQAQVVNDFVDDILDADENANVIVLGDINDFEFSETVEILEGGGVLTSLMNTLPKAERYSYVFEGNSQVLDQILVSENLSAGFPIEYDVVHVNSEFADQVSDHDPQVARLDLRGRPRP